MNEVFKKKFESTNEFTLLSFLRTKKAEIEKEKKTRLRTMARHRPPGNSSSDDDERGGIGGGPPAKRIKRFRHKSKAQAAKEVN